MEPEDLRSRVRERGQEIEENVGPTRGQSAEVCSRNLCRS